MSFYRESSYDSLPSDHSEDEDGGASPVPDASRPASVVVQLEKNKAVEVAVSHIPTYLLLMNPSASQSVPVAAQSSKAVIESSPSFVREGGLDAPATSSGTDEGFEGFALIPRHNLPERAVSSSPPTLPTDFFNSPGAKPTDFLDLISDSDSDFEIIEDHPSPRKQPSVGNDRDSDVEVESFCPSEAKDTYRQLSLGICYEADASKSNEPTSQAIPLISRSTRPSTLSRTPSVPPISSTQHSTSERSTKDQTHLRVRTRSFSPFQIEGVNLDWAPVPPECSKLLAPLQKFVDNINSVLLWHDPVESNPLWDLEHGILMGEMVMNLVVTYLSYQANLRAYPTRGYVLVIPPGVYVQCISQSDRICWELVWGEPELPSRIVVPIINHQEMHCYVFYGDVETDTSGHNSLHLKYLDSLASVSSKLFKTRLLEVVTALQILLPELDDITGEHQRVPKYEQAPGSLDCGFFVCQAVSALANQSPSALYNLDSVEQTKHGMQKILESCRDGALDRLLRGMLPEEPIILHRHRRIAPPPWKKEPLDAHAEKSLLRVSEKDFIEEGAPSGWEGVYGRRPDHIFRSTGTHGFTGLIASLVNAPRSGKLEGLGKHLPELLMAALLLKEHSGGGRKGEKLAPGIVVVNQWKEVEFEDTEDTIGVASFVATMSSYGAEERAKATLTGMHKGKQIRLDWKKGALELDEEMLVASLDIDSLSLTVDNPEFTTPLTVHAYPPRASTLTADNGLKISHEGKKKNLSQILNFTCFATKEFTVNVFFPRYEVDRRKDNRYKNMMRDEDYKIWYDSAWRAALKSAGRKAPANLREGFTQILQELPSSYKIAQVRAVGSTRSFAGYKVTQEIINLTLIELRRIVDRTLSLWKFRDYFFHIQGKNLKCVAQALSGRADNNPLLHVFSLYPIVDWDKQNPSDIVVDVGIEINVDKEKIPEEMRNITLLWDQNAVRRLVTDSWCGLRLDAYIHSHVIGGLKAQARSHIQEQFFNLQFYQKDKLLTYIHSDNSIGAGFSAADGIWGSQKYSREIDGLKTVWGNPKCHGIRAEWRLRLWGANEMVKIDPNMWRQKFFEENAIVAFHSAHVAGLKLALLDGYDWFFRRMQENLSSEDRISDGVVLLASALVHLIRGIVKRPDDMSASRSMVSEMGLTIRAIRYGFASMHPDRLGFDLMRMDGDITVEDWPILKYAKRKCPAGARLKHSVAVRLPNAISAAPATLAKSALPTNPSALSAASKKYDGLGLSGDDIAWVKKLLDTSLAGWLWSKFPDRDKRSSGSNIRGPLLYSNWFRDVKESIVHSANTKIADAFFNAVDRLFPDDWVLAGTTSNKQWRNYQESILDPIRERVANAGAAESASYSDRLRSVIRLHLRETWDYLPPLQKSKIWPTSGKGNQRYYNTCLNHLRQKNRLNR